MDGHFVRLRKNVGKLNRFRDECKDKIFRKKSQDGCAFNLYLSYSKAPDDERPIDCTFIHRDYFFFI